ncbi:MAG: hypothetical protein KDD43_00225 [Bdellovibrionales bacterium]|nr:hypothetical protein [Bdellovibrionales bacterium]
MPIFYPCLGTAVRNYRSGLEFIREITKDHGNGIYFKTWRHAKDEEELIALVNRAIDRESRIEQSSYPYQGEVDLESVKMNEIGQDNGGIAKKRGRKTDQEGPKRTTEIEEIQLDNARLKGTIDAYRDIFDTIIGTFVGAFSDMLAPSREESESDE